ncbi:site-specific integrase [Daejeonella sp. JGW-45]|uniref:site-specific integrase n=1 Tax=Daejeonella sp. JGW-45 TaxID=3034148 RepID=UPI0023ED3F0E|nr:site-specific integrase [Daejeonella sp. JGW-45]
MFTTFNVLFYLKKRNPNQTGPLPISLRIGVNGQRTEVSTGRTWEASRWNSHAGRALGTKEDAKALNAFLDTLQAKLSGCHHLLTEAGKEITADNLRDMLTGRKRQRSKMLLDVFKEHNDRIEALLGNGFEPNTLKGYRTTVNHLTAFIGWKFKAEDIELYKLDHAFITDFDFYLRSECGISGVSGAKYIKNLKKIVNSALAHGWLPKNPFANYKSKAKAGERVFLTKDELERMHTKEIAIGRIAQVRDIFLFCCYTGLAYIDIKKLKRSEIGVGVDGETWIFTTRQKTDTSSRIPLLSQAQEILDKYKDHPQCDADGALLPVLSNQKMNSYLKEIADTCGITKTLTFHIARHTFATTVTLSNGVPIETVSKMLGHTNLKTTQHYAKILDIKVSEDMKMLRKKLARNR